MTHTSNKVLVQIMSRDPSLNNRSRATRSTSSKRGENGKHSSSVNNTGGEGGELQLKSQNDQHLLNQTAFSGNGGGVGGDILNMPADGSGVHILTNTSQNTLALPRSVVTDVDEAIEDQQGAVGGGACGGQQSATSLEALTKGIRLPKPFNSKDHDFSIWVKRLDRYFTRLHIDNSVRTSTLLFNLDDKTSDAADQLKLNDTTPYNEAKATLLK